MLLNGPPGIGKSTIADLYADRHPGNLNLDIDRLHQLVGGWRDYDNRTHDILRPVALAMASTHLAGRRDVVVPQHLGRSDEIQAFSRIAHEHGADFQEIVLIDAKAESIARFERRVGAEEWDEHNRKLVESLGGRDFLAHLYDQLEELIKARPSSVVVRSEAGDVESTYALLVQALTSSPP